MLILALLGMRRVHIDKEMTMTDNAMIDHEALADVIENAPTGEEERTEKFIELLPKLILVAAGMDQRQVGGFSVSSATYNAVSDWCRKASNDQFGFHSFRASGEGRCILHINWTSTGR